VGSVAFQRIKPAAIGTKAPFLGFIDPAMATSIEKVPVGESLDPRDQIRWLPRPRLYAPRLDQSIQENRIRCLAN
jgi:hypothetical protein